MQFVVWWSNVDRITFDGFDYMTEVETRVSLEESLRDKVSGEMLLMKTDFRKLVARYICLAIDKSMCTRFLPSVSGNCTFLGSDRTCGSE
jgi:hypothetical protein